LIEYVQIGAVKKKDNS